MIRDTRRKASLVLYIRTNTHTGANTDTGADSPDEDTPENMVVAFRSESRWIHPLFELEHYVEGQEGEGGKGAARNKAGYVLYDSIVGMAAAYLILRLGISEVLTNTISEPALALMQKSGVKCVPREVVPAIGCRTEELLREEGVSSVDVAYRLLSRMRSAGQTKDAQIFTGDILDIFPSIAEKSIRLIYIDPPFNTGKQMTYTKIKTVKDEDGDRTGYNDQKYKTKSVSTLSYNDKIEDYISYVIDRVKKSYQLLQNNGSIFLHVDYREVHYLKVEMDKIFGRENFMNEIIWSYDYGARSKTRWACKHDSILWYAVNKNEYIYNYNEIDRIEYMAPALVGAEKAERGKVPTDVWWNSIVGTNSRERKAGMGYPTQKPLKILERIVKVHSNEGDTVLDFFAGTGTTGVAAIKHNRKAILIDSNPVATDIMKSRISSERAPRAKVE